MPRLWLDARVLAGNPVQATLATSLHDSKALHDGHTVWATMTFCRKLWPHLQI
jgi:hypothetical protein